jgi:hypothetical protein
MSNIELIEHMRREHTRMVNFPEQGYDWRTPITAMLNRVPELLDALEAADALLATGFGDAAEARAALERVQDEATVLSGAPSGANFPCSEAGELFLKLIKGYK